ncbi:MAG: AMP-binding protein, partial [Candidatus Eremiobacteraeota bacterium]|nr:AMP-binding protein [Candidatus Eremiobacteraeota bacterium]
MNERHFAYWPKRRPREFPVPATSVAHNLATSAARYPEHPAIVYYDTPIAYRRLWDEVERLAGFLEHAAGVRRGDRVLLFMQNSPQYVIAYYAILRANAVVVALNPMLVTEELEAYVDDSGATVAIAGQELAPKLKPYVPSPVHHVVVAAYSDYVERPTDLALPPAVAAPRAAFDAGGFVAWHDALASAEPPGP